MSLRPDRLTLKSQEALQDAQATAQQAGNPEVTPLHLLSSLCRQPEGIVVPVLDRLGASPGAVSAAAAERLSSLPRVQGGTAPAASRALSELFRAAEKAAAEFQDEYVSTEHFLLALARGSGEAPEVLRRFGATPGESWPLSARSAAPPA